jgi:hypothetical protein
VDPLVKTFNSGRGDPSMKIYFLRTDNKTDMEFHTLLVKIARDQEYQRIKEDSLKGWTGIPS